MGEANPKRYETTVQDDGAIIHTPVEPSEGLATGNPTVQPIIKLSAEHVTARSAPNQPPNLFPRTMPPREATPPTIAIQFPPPRPRPTAPKPVQPRETAVMPRPAQAQRPVANYAPAAAERKRTRVVALGLVSAIAIGGITAWKWNNNEQSAPKTTALGKQFVQPEAPPAALGDLSAEQPPPTDLTDLSLLIPVATAKAPGTVAPNKTKASSQHATKKNAAPTLSDIRSLPTSVTPEQSPTPSTVTTPGQSPVPSANTPSQSPTPEQSPTPSTTAPEQQPTPTPNFDLSPSPASSKLLGEFVDTSRKQDLIAKYPALKNYLDLKILAGNGELNNLNRNDIMAHQKTVLDADNNPDVHQILGNLASLSEASLNNMKISGDSPANQLLTQTDNELRNAQTLYSIIGNSAAELPYLNSGYVSSALTSLENGADLSVPNAQNATVVSAQRVILAGGTEVEMVAVVADYTQNGTTTTVLRWMLTEPISPNEFIGVTIDKKDLGEVTPNTPNLTPTPTATENGNFWSNFLGKFGNNNNNSNKDVRKHGRA